MGSLRQPQSEKADARSEFARRLRELRVPRGFRTARSLARALEIDENRYTRYERAEVEPDLAMIRRICEILRITPNDLLGSACDNQAGSQASASGAAGEKSTLGDEAQSKVAPGSEKKRTASEPVVRLSLATSAWALAEAVIALRHGHSHAGNGASSPAANGSSSPLADVGATGTLYRSLMQQPFEAISALLEEPTVAQAPALVAKRLRSRIDDVLERLRAGDSA